MWRRSANSENICIDSGHLVRHSIELVMGIPNDFTPYSLQIAQEAPTELGRLCPHGCDRRRLPQLVQREQHTQSRSFSSRNSLLGAMSGRVNYDDARCFIVSILCSVTYLCEWGWTGCMRSCVKIFGADVGQEGPAQPRQWTTGRPWIIHITLCSRPLSAVLFSFLVVVVVVSVER